MLEKHAVVIKIMQYLLRKFTYELLGIGHLKDLLDFSSKGLICIPALSVCSFLNIPQFL